MPLRDADAAFSPCFIAADAPCAQHARFSLPTYAAFALRLPLLVVTSLRYVSLLPMLPPLMPLLRALSADAAA